MFNTLRETLDPGICIGFVENVFLWFLYFQVEFTNFQERVVFQVEVLLADAGRLFSEAF
jgi:hypothetical protein